MSTLIGVQTMTTTRQRRPRSRRMVALVAAAAAAVGNSRLGGLPRTRSDEMPPTNVASE